MAVEGVPTTGKPDYGDYSYRKTVLMSIDTRLMSVAFIIDMLRFYTRCYISRYFGPDDWWILVAWVCFSATVSAGLLLVFMVLTLFI